MTDLAAPAPTLTNSPDVSLETERLRLRVPDVTDAVRIAELVTPEVSRWMASWPAPCTLEFAEDRIARARKAMAAGRALPLVIDEAVGEATIGMVEAFASRDEPGRVTLGFWLGQPWHGRGYMSEAVGAVLRHLARDPAVRVIDGGAQLANDASKGVMTKLGMQCVGPRVVFSSARQRDEPCEFYEIEASAVV